MKVVTVKHEDFLLLCKKLAEQIKASGFNPDLIIGIKTGGSYVADAIAPFFPIAQKADVAIRRKSTASKKQPAIQAMVKLLPVCILNCLRILESLITRHRRHATREGSVSLSAEADSFLTIGQRHVLIVDDAIDSGATIRKVTDSLSAKYPHCTFRIAVITVTTPNPIAKADFYLYNNNTLIRFPWAIDAKK